MEEKVLSERWENQTVESWENCLKDVHGSSTNRAFITGRLDSEFKFSYELNGIKFYETRVRVKRRSGFEDYVPIRVPKFLIKREWGLLDDESLFEGKRVEVSGEFRSANEISKKDGKSHLKLFIFATQFKLIEDDENSEFDKNLVFLDSYICKEPLYRRTVLRKEITDVLVAVNRSCRKSDYVPCIAWERSARLTAKFQIGDRLKLYGRIQSRKYFKKFSDDFFDGEWRETLELSISSLKNVKVSEYTEKG